MNWKWQRRERKQRKRKYGMRVDGRSILTLTRVQADRAERLRRSKRKRSSSK